LSYLDGSLARINPYLLIVGYNVKELVTMDGKSG
jgi:hypothetical protein